jgi:adenylate kinase family enzyme
MTVKLFILGRPGSGKSYAARYIELDVRIKDGSSYRINDMKYLRRLSLLDKEHTRFEPKGNGGFNVRDRSALDEALIEVVKEAQNCFQGQIYDLMMIEFARSNYGGELRKFGSKFLQDALFLFIDAGLDTCFERIQIRAANPQFPDDDIFVAKETLLHFYGKDDKSYMSGDFLSDFGLQDWQVKCIDNVRSIEEFEAQLSEFIQVFQERIGQSPETDPLQPISTAVLDCQVSK